MIPWTAHEQPTLKKKKGAKADPQSLTAMQHLKTVHTIHQKRRFHQTRTKTAVKDSSPQRKKRVRDWTLSMTLSPRTRRESAPLPYDIDCLHRATHFFLSTCHRRESTWGLREQGGAVCLCRVLLSAARASRACLQLLRGLASFQRVLWRDRCRGQRASPPANGHWGVFQSSPPRQMATGECFSHSPPANGHWGVFHWSFKMIYAQELKKNSLWIFHSEAPWQALHLCHQARRRLLIKFA